MVSHSAAALESGIYVDIMSFIPGYLLEKARAGIVISEGIAEA
jgi:hypothetical protein